MQLAIMTTIGDPLPSPHQHRGISRATRNPSVTLGPRQTAMACFCHSTPLPDPTWSAVWIGPDAVIGSRAWRYSLPAIPVLCLIYRSGALGSCTLITLLSLDSAEPLSLFPQSRPSLASHRSRSKLQKLRLDFREASRARYIPPRLASHAVGLDLFPHHRFFFHNRHSVKRFYSRRSGLLLPIRQLCYTTCLLSSIPVLAGPRAPNPVRQQAGEEILC